MRYVGYERRNGWMDSPRLYVYFPTELSLRPPTPNSHAWFSDAKEQKAREAKAKKRSSWFGSGKKKSVEEEEEEDDYDEYQEVRCGCIRHRFPGANTRVVVSAVWGHVRVVWVLPFIDPQLLK